MKKIASLFILLLAVLAAGASTPYKNLYVVAKLAPSGSGKIYLVPKPGDEDYVRDTATTDDESYVQCTVGENGNEGTTYACGSNTGVYEMTVYVEPASGYELVCLANKVKEDGVYYSEDCYAVFDSYDSGNRQASFDYTVSDLGFIINVNNMETHPQEDGSSSGEINRDMCYADDSKWSPTPDTEVYAIMRKKGDKTPKLDLSEKPDYVNNTTDVTDRDNAIYTNAIFCRAGSELLIPVCIKNKGTQVAGVQFTMETNGATPLETAVDYQLEEYAGALDFCGMNVESNKIRLAAWSKQTAALSAEQGDMLAVTLYVPEGTSNGNYDIKFSGIVFSTPDGKAVKADDTYASIIVGDYDIPESVGKVVAEPKGDGRIFTITGVQMKNADQPGLYIRDGKKFIVR